MKPFLLVLLISLLCTNPALAKDGNCKCIFKVQKEQLEQVSANSTRPVICDSCKERCELLIDKVKEEQKAKDVTLEKFSCS